MTIRLNPYLNFHGQARAALEHYHRVLGGKLEIMRYDSIPGMMGADDEGDKVMHGQLETDDGLTLMAADYPASMESSPDASLGGHSVCMSGDDMNRVQAIWDGLVEDGEVREPLAQAPWGDTFGMLTDGFGVPWMFSCSPPAEG